MANETYEFILSGTLAGQFVQSVLHANVANTTDQNPFAMANELLLTFNAAGDGIELWCNMLPSDYQLTSARCRRILSAGGPTQIFLPATLHETIGQRAGLVSTAAANPLFIWLTTVRPAKTGRTFVPGVSETDIAEMVLASGLLTAMAAFGDYWRDGGTTITNAFNWTGAILRRELNGSDDITNYRVSPIIGQQRRRLRPV